MNLRASPLRLRFSEEVISARLPFSALLLPRSSRDLAKFAFHPGFITPNLRDFPLPTVSKSPWVKTEVHVSQMHKKFAGPLQESTGRQLPAVRSIHTNRRSKEPARRFQDSIRLSTVSGSRLFRPSLHRPARFPARKAKRVFAFTKLMVLSTTQPKNPAYIITSFREGCRSSLLRLPRS
jgi:hypothetical protein